MVVAVNVNVPFVCENAINEKELNAMNKAIFIVVFIKLVVKMLESKILKRFGIYFLLSSDSKFTIYSAGEISK